MRTDAAPYRHRLVAVALAAAWVAAFAASSPPATGGQPMRPDHGCQVVAHTLPSGTGTAVC